MPPPANIAKLIVLAGFGVAAGIAVLYHYLTTRNSGEEQHRYRRNSPPPSSAGSSPSPSPERRRLRAISPPREIHRENQLGRRRATQREAPTSNPGSNRVRARAEESLPCRICSGSMSAESRTITLDCRHVFHDECYTIWRHAVVMANPHADLCPTC